MISVYAYEAGEGDFLRIRYKNEDEHIFHNIIIDSGKKWNKKKEKNRMSFGRLLETLSTSPEDTIDAIFITHWDADHIEGFLYDMNSFPDHVISAIGTVYLNSGVSHYKGIQDQDNLHNAKQALEVARFLTEKGISWEDGHSIEMQYDMKDQPLFSIGGAGLWLISPGEEQLEKLKKSDSQVADYVMDELHAQSIKVPGSFAQELVSEIGRDTSAANGSSIAFLFEYENTRIAFLGDAHPEVCIAGLNALGFDKTHPCFADMIKVPHHGSSRNYRKELYEILVSDSYLVSTDGRIRSGNMLPNKSFLSRAWLDIPHKDLKLNLYCNYPWWNNKDDREYYFQMDSELEKEETTNSLTLHLNLQNENYELNLIDINSSSDPIHLKEGLELCPQK